MRLVMMGTGTFAEPAFQALLACPHPVVGLVTQPDRVAGAERGSTRQTGVGMATLAHAHGVPVFQPDCVNTPDGVAGIQAFQPDLLVVAAYGQILSNDVLLTAPQGGINVHASLLPKYRGAAPVAWAIYHGETRTGVTIIRMSVRLDAGEILAQEALDIQPDETAGELEARLAPVGARLAIQVADQIAQGETHGVKQDSSQVTKAPKLKKEQGLIDWTRSASQVCNQVRAMQPWPTAYTYRHRAGHSSTRLLITRSVPAGDHAPSNAAPGQLIADADRGRLLVAVGSQGIMEVLELQPAGKRRMSAAEYLRGHPILTGDRFGQETA